MRPADCQCRPISDATRTMQPGKPKTIQCSNGCVGSSLAAKSCPACCAKAESGTHTGGKTEHLLRLLEACGAVASWRTRAILQNASGNACPPKHAESSRLTNLKGPCLGGRSLPGCLRTFVFKGLTQTQNASKQGLEACHVFKFVRRESVHQNVRIRNPFCGVPESSRCVVFLVKQYIGSEVLTQPPQFAFHSPVKYLPQEEFPLSSSQVLPREQLSRRQCQEFLKTAQLVSEPPWGLHRAASYLRTFVSDNETGSSPKWAALAIHWVFEEPAPSPRTASCGT